MIVGASLHITSTAYMDKVLVAHPARGTHPAVSLHRELQSSACGSKPGLLKPPRSPRRWGGPRARQISSAEVI